MVLLNITAWVITKPITGLKKNRKRFPLEASEQKRSSIPHGQQSIKNHISFTVLLPVLVEYLENLKTFLKLKFLHFEN